MIKAKFYLLAGLSTIMLGACSDDLGSDTTGNKTPVEGEGVMHINLNFPGMSANTRAQGDQSFENGTAEESDVKDATVYYFDKDSKYLDGVKATNIIPGEGDGTNTETRLIVQVPAELVKNVKGENYANIIVVLNKPAGFLSGKSISTYDEFNAALTATDNAGFMMSSVNYYPNEVVTYFTKITEQNIKEEGQPVGDDVVKVYVERVCAKVELSAAELESKDATVAVRNWGLNVRNKSVYPVKVLDESFTKLQDTDQSSTATYWPGADNWTHADAVDRHRSFWAKDPNYADGDNYTIDSDSENNPFKVIKFSDLTADPRKGALYCLENTFDQDHQDRDETTTAVILAQYLPEKFEESGTLPEGNSTWVMQNGLYYTLDTYVNNFLVRQNIYTVNEETLVSATKDNVTFTYDGEEINGKLIGATNFAFAPKEGSTVVKEDVEEKKGYSPYEDADWTALNKVFKEYSSTASIYVNGYCYYEVPIRHFNDTEVPLAATEAGINKLDQLGRYGVVRNHCYKLTVKSVTKPGKPIPGEEKPIIPEDGPDDPSKKHNITVGIEVLQWAVRNQEVNL